MDKQRWKFICNKIRAASILLGTVLGLGAALAGQLAICQAQVPERMRECAGLRPQPSGVCGPIPVTSSPSWSPS